jgi:hypothetical protein
MHVHVYHADGEAEFWLEPTVEIARNFGLPAKELHEAEGLVRSHEIDLDVDSIRHPERFPLVSQIMS